MNPKIPCLVVWILFQFHLSGTSQFDFKNFPIDSFALPDIMWRGLELGGSLAGDYTDFTNGNNFPSTKYSEIDSRVWMRFSNYINRADLQSGFNLYISPEYSGSRYKSENSDFLGSTRRFNPEVSFSGIQRKYHGNSFFHIEAAGSLDYLTSQENEEYSLGTEKSDRHRFSASIQVPIGIGKGRIELVSDLVMALFLLQDASELGIDEQNLNQDDILDFAALMASVRNERIFDTRRKRIHELRSLYDYMLDKGWVMPNDPGYFTVLTDNWLYNFRYPRQSGQRLTFLITPQLNFLSDNQKNTPGIDLDTRTRTIGGDISMNFTRYKPQSLHRDFWHSHTISIGVQDENERANAFEFTEALLYGEISNGFGLNFYPNSRTEIFTRANLDYTYLYDLESNGISSDRDEHSLSTNISIQCNYFLSYKTRLIINASLGYGLNSIPQALIMDEDIIFINQGANRLLGSINAGITTFLY